MARAKPTLAPLHELTPDQYADCFAQLAHAHFAARVEHARDTAGVARLDLRLLFEDLQLQPARVDLHEFEEAVVVRERAPVPCVPR